MPPDAVTPAPAVRALNCPSCGGSVDLRAAGYTVHVGCQYCGSILDVADAQVKLVVAYNEAVAALEIPLGTRGVLNGVEWEAIGYLRRSENGAYGWEEYLLFNPYHGYRWLVNVRGGWSFGEQLTVAPERVTHETQRLGLDFYNRFFADGTAQVDYVVGEFFWRVQVGERVTTNDWVTPGLMLSSERNEQEISWTRNAWITSREIGEAFGIQPDPDPWPPLPHQPSPWGQWLKAGLTIGIAAVVALILFAMVFSGTYWSDARTFAIASFGQERSATLGPIRLPLPYQSVRIRADVPRLENGWVDLDYSLVDRRTQQVFEAYGAAERYSGYDSDGSWTEGTRQTEVSIASVPAGDYDLVVDYKGNRWNASDSSAGWMAVENEPEVTIAIGYGRVYGSSFVIALILMLAPLVYAVARHFAFETARRGESDFATSWSGDDD